jgi:hypothetical protein
MNETHNQAIPSTFFGELFKQLEPHDKQVGLRTKQSDKLFNGEPIFAGRDHLGNPHLLIPLDAAGVFEATMLTNYIGVEKRILVHPNGNEHEFLDLFCLVSDVDALFSPICEEISETLAAIGSGEVTLIASRVGLVVERWREILKALENKEISGNQITGLIGELLTLRCLVETLGPAAVSGWFGQDKTRHDFEYENVAFEAKASTVLSRKACTIHGINQLSAASGTSLKLVHFQIERSASGMTVAKLIEELADQVGGPQKIQSKMQSIWPVLGSMPNWFSAWSFKVVSASLYEVDEDFPRIHSNTAPSAHMAHISDLRYMINLESLATVAEKSSTNWRGLVQL